MKLEISGEILVKSSNVKFHENPSSRRRVVQCRWMDGQPETDMTKVIVIFHNFGKTSKTC